MTRIHCGSCEEDSSQVDSSLSPPPPPWGHPELQEIDRGFIATGCTSLTVKFRGLVPQSAEHVPSSYSEPGYIVDGLLVLVLLLAGGLVLGGLVGGVNAGQSVWEVNGGGGEEAVVSVLRLNGLLGAVDKVGLIGAGGCGADTEGSGTSCASSANLSSRSTFGLSGKALLSTGGGALLFTGAAGPTGALGTHTSGLGPLNRGDSTAGLKFHRYRRFLSVNLPDPSTLTVYLSKPRS